MQQDNDNAMSFADMFRESEAAEERLVPGQKIEAEIVRIGKEWAFLDLGGKSEGAIALAELLDKEGNLAVHEGERIAVYFLGARRNEKMFTRTLAGSSAGAHLEEAYQSGIPVEGMVRKEVKGGFEVKIGTVRAFCPYSQIALQKTDDNEAYIGQQLSFKVIEFRENGKNIILSHRKVLEEERERRKEELRGTLEVGQLVEGVITSVRDFGAFVDIGGVEGLIPISELSYGRVEDIHSVVERGRTVQVAIKKLDWDKDRFSFSLRDTLPDPWEQLDLHEGSVLVGVVSRLADFGAFITLAPGIDGLAHISKLGAGRRINHPREVVREGEEIEVCIDSIDRGQKRISLSLPKKQEENAERVERGRKRKPAEKADEMHDEFQRFKQTRRDDGQRASMGTFADLLKEKLKR